MEKVKAVAEVNRSCTAGGMPPVLSTASSPTWMASNRSGSPPPLAPPLRLSLIAVDGGTQRRQHVVDPDGGLMLVWPIGDRRVLAVAATGTVEQPRVPSFVQARAGWLAGAAS